MAETLKKKPTDDQLSNARKGGFKAKKPPKPKRTESGTPVTLARLEKWVKSYNKWVTKVHAGGAKHAKKGTDKKRFESLKDQVSNR